LYEPSQGSSILRRKAFQTWLAIQDSNREALPHHPRPEPFTPPTALSLLEGNLEWLMAEELEQPKKQKIFSWTDKS
jgi:hypothetical protein